MLRLSKMTDYGILVLVRVAGAEAGSLHTARDLAAHSGLAVTTVSKVVKALVREGFLESRRGAHGGYCLARDASTIAMVDVIAALEGPVGLTACAAHQKGGASCDIATTCPARKPWQKLNALVVGALASVTLKDMAGPHTSRHAPHAPSLRSLP